MATSIHTILQAIADTTAELQILAGNSDNLASQSLADTVDLEGVLHTLTEALGALLVHGAAAEGDYSYDDDNHYTVI